MGLRIAFVALAVATVTLASCALRPRYSQLVEAGTDQGETVVVAFTDEETGAPIPGMRVVIGDGPNKVQLVTDQNGEVHVPRSSRLERENPLVVVDRPAGIARYAFSAPAGSAPEQAAPDEGEGQAGPGQPADDNASPPVMTGPAGDVARPRDPMPADPSDAGTTTAD